MLVTNKLIPIACLILVNFGSCVTVGNKFEGNLAPDDIENLKEEGKKNDKKEEREKLEVTFDQVSETMMNYVSDNTVDTREACRFNREGCVEFLDMYLNRCKKGDCYTLDNIQLVKFPDGFEIDVPNLNQYVFARSIFERSKAMKKIKFYNIPAKIVKRFKGPDPNSLETFDKNIFKTNIPNMNFMGDVNRMVLTEVLYKATLHYLTYIFENPFSAGRNEYRFFRLFFRWKQRSWLVSTAKNIAKVKRVVVGMRNLKSLIDSYLLYLNTSGVVGHNRLNLSYSKLVKHSMMILMGDKKVGFLMSDYMMRVPVNPKKYCVPNSPSDCYQMLVNYTYRCEDGDCMVLDPVMLLDGKDYLNVKLPQLNELDLAFDLFSGSRARSRPFLDFILRRKNRISVPVFANKLLKVNTDNEQYNSRDHKVFAKFLYFATIYYKRRSLMGKFKRLFCKGVEKTLKEFLGDLVSSTAVDLDKERVAAMFVAYRNYLFNSKFFNNKDDVVNYVQKSNDVFLYYMDSYNLLKDTKKKEEKNKKNGEEKVGEDNENKEEKKEKNVFDWESEDQEMYEKAHKVPIDVIDMEQPSTSGIMSVKS